jgi:transcriptional regulator GlxA family with amidase domain
MVVYLRRTASDPQISPWLEHRNHLHRSVHRAQEAILREPSRPWSLAEIARVAHTSERHLTRLFREHTGVSALGYLQHIRVTLARERLRTTTWSREQVAESAGFSSAHQMRRVLRQLGEPS